MHLSDPEVQKKLLTLEEQEGAVNFKIGILYAQPGQTTDDEMFSNGATRHRISALRKDRKELTWNVYV